MIHDYITYMYLFELSFFFFLKFIIYYVHDCVVSHQYRSSNIKFLLNALNFLYVLYTSPIYIIPNMCASDKFMEKPFLVDEKHSSSHINEAIYLPFVLWTNRIVLRVVVLHLHPTDWQKKPFFLSIWNPTIFRPKFIDNFCQYFSRPLVYIYSNV